MNDFLKQFENDNKYVVSLEDSRITCTNDHTKESLIEFLTKLYDFEDERIDIVEEDGSKRWDYVFKGNIFLDLKGLNVDLLAEAIKYSLTREDLRNATMILNIINLVKLDNTLDETYFSLPYTYIADLEAMVDIKLLLEDDISIFVQTLSIYFISLFKSLNKLSYSNLEKQKYMPSIFKNIFLATDFMTLSGIFASSKPFDTSRCEYIVDSLLYLTSLTSKSAMSSMMMEMFFKDKLWQ